jgi:hypothetical protein
MLEIIPVKPGFGLVPAQEGETTKLSGKSHLERQILSSQDSRITEIV